MLNKIDKKKSQLNCQTILFLNFIAFQSECSATVFDCVKRLIENN